MKKFFKGLALVLALVLVLGTIPASNASAKVKTSKKLYLNGGSAKKNTAKLYKLAGVSKADASKVTAESSDSKIVKAGSKKLTAKAAGVADVKILVDGNLVTTVKVTVKDLAAKEAKLEAKATGVREITVTGVDEKATVTVKRGSTTVGTTAKFADGKMVLTLDSKIRDAEYTISDGTNSVVLKGEDEKVASITILENGGQVNTGNNGTEVYVHYDVLNQYGESVRKNFAPKFTSNVASLGNVDPDAETGIITLTKDNGATYNYNDFVTVVAVFTDGANSATATATMTVGLPVAIGQVKVLGIYNADTKKEVEEVPKNFAAGDYVLVYSLLDQNGLAIEYSDEYNASDLNVTSTNPLVASVEKFTLANSYIELDGTYYGKFNIVPGTYAKQGGDVPVIITSSTTGQQTNYTLTVEPNQVLKSFKIMAPSDFVTEYDENDNPISLEYEALDTNGDPVTNYRVLCGALSVNASRGEVWVQENDDKTFTVLYCTPDDGASKAVAGIDTITAIVAEQGSVCTLQINYKDDDFVDAIVGYKGKTVYVEGDTFVVDVNNWSGWKNYLQFADQYDRQYNDGDNIAQELTHRTTEYADCDGIYVKASNNAITISGTPVDGWYPLNGATFTANNADGNFKEVVLEFALFDATEAKPLGGTSKRVTFTVVDITKVNNFSVAPSQGKIQNANWKTYNNRLSTADDAVRTTGFNVSGSYKGTSVSVPQKYVYYTVNKGIGTGVTTGGAITASAGIAFDIQNYGDDVSTKYDFYNYSSVNANGTFNTQAVSAKVTAVVCNRDIVGFEVDAINDCKLASVTANYSILVDNKNYVSFTTRNNGSVVWGSDTTTATITPVDGVIKYSAFISGINKMVDNYDIKDDPNGIKVSVYNYISADDNIVAPDAAIVSASAEAECPMIENAQIGDTFVVEYSKGGAKIKATFTVGADAEAYIEGAYVGDWR